MLWDVIWFLYLLPRCWQPVSFYVISNPSLAGAVVDSVVAPVDHAFCLLMVDALGCGCLLDLSDAEHFGGTWPSAAVCLRPDASAE